MDPNDRSHLGRIVDSTIKIKPGRKLRSFLLKDDFKLGYSSKEYLTVAEIKKIRESIKVEDDDEIYEGIVYLHELLEGSELILPSLVIPPRNPELEKRVQTLKLKLAEEDYQKMVQNVSAGNRFKAEDSVGMQLKQINSGLIGVFQFVVTIGAAFMFGFLGIEVFGGYNLDLAVRLLLGIIFALIVGLAELYFLAVNLSISESPVHTSSNANASIVPKIKQNEGHSKVE